MLSAGDLSVQKGFDDDSTDGDGGGEHDFGSGAGTRVCRWSRVSAWQDGNTNREKTKEWIRMMDKESKGFKKRLYGALERGHISGFLTFSFT